MNCSYCGRRVPGRLVDVIEFCRGCGAPFNDKDDSVSDRTKADLQERYNEEIRQIVNHIHPTIRRGDVQSIVELKRRYQSLGLAVY
jgi:hypothetical protein